MGPRVRTSSIFLLCLVIPGTMLGQSKATHTLPPAARGTAFQRYAFHVVTNADNVFGIGKDALDALNSLLGADPQDSTQWQGGADTVLALALKARTSAADFDAVEPPVGFSRLHSQLVEILGRQVGGVQRIAMASRALCRTCSKPDDAIRALNAVQQGTVEMALALKDYIEARNRVEARLDAHHVRLSSFLGNKSTKNDATGRFTHAPESPKRDTTDKSILESSHPTLDTIDRSNHAPEFPRTIGFFSRLTSPKTFGFKISQNFSQTVDATAAGGGVQSLDATFDLYVTLKSSDSIYVDLMGSDSAGGRAIAVTVDSLVPGAGADPQVMGMLSGMLKGASGNGAVTAAGEITGFTSGNVQQNAQLKGIARLVFPEMKRGAKAGDSWTDTVSTTDSAMGGGAMTRKAITSHTAAAGDAWSGTPTLRVTTATNYSVAGMAQGGMQIEGTGKSNAVLDVTAEGELAKGQASDESTLTATPPGSADALPISNKTSSVITRLP